MEKPQPVRIDVPVEYGEVYAGQWVERAIRVSRDDFKAMRKIEESKVSWMRDDKVLGQLAEVLSHIYTDWNLEGNGGPLPKPWGDPKAFEALAASDLNLFLWIVRNSLKSVGELIEPPKN